MPIGSTGTVQAKSTSADRSHRFTKYPGALWAPGENHFELIFYRIRTATIYYKFGCSFLLQLNLASSRLHLKQSLIQSILADQLGMSPALFDPAFFEYQYFVGVPYSAKPMGNY